MAESKAQEELDVEYDLYVEENYVEAESEVKPEKPKVMVRDQLREQEQKLAEEIREVVVAGLEEFKPGLSKDADVLREALEEVGAYVEGWQSNKYVPFGQARQDLAKGQWIGSGQYQREKYCPAELRAGIRRQMSEGYQRSWDAEPLKSRSGYAIKALQMMKSHKSATDSYPSFEEVCKEMASDFQRYSFQR